jgi:hypothetical protein
MRGLLCVLGLALFISFTFGSVLLSTDDDTDFVSSPASTPKILKEVKGVSAELTVSEPDYYSDIFRTLIDLHLDTTRVTNEEI